MNRKKPKKTVIAIYNNDSLTPAELESLKRGLKEALLIKEGKIKPISFCEVWDD